MERPPPVAGHARAHVHDMLDEIIDRSALVQANRVFSQFRAMCRWAVGRGIIDRAPTEGLTAPSVEARRERVLTDAELCLAWRAAGIIGWPFGAVAELLILTGARKSEVANMRWSELDLAGRVWRLPKERSKNGREHTVPLSDPAIAILEGLPRIGDAADGFVFSVRSGAPIRGFSRAKMIIDRTILELMRAAASARGDDPQRVRAPEPWVLHDLRRSVATSLQRLGVRLEVTEAVLNHVSGSRGGVTGIYQRHTWAEEKRAALDAWAARLDAILGGEPAATNVIEIARART
jgi:integrase